MSKKKIRKYILGTLTVLFSVTLIVVFLPREKSFSYEFQQGRPWRYEQLTAPWDFVVDKSDEVFKREQDNAAARVLPYYILDTSVASAAADSLQQHYLSRLSQVMSSRLYTTVSRRLQETYTRGIVEKDYLDALQRDSISRIKLIRGNTANEKAVGELLTVKDAYKYVMQADTSAWGAYVLSNCNLNDYIRANVMPDNEKTEAARQDAIDAVLHNKGLIQAGQKIIGYGDIVDEDAHQTLLSYRREWLKHNESTGSELTLVGQILLVLLLVIGFIVYLSIYRQEYLQKPSYYLFLVTQITIFPIIAALCVNTVGVMIIPFVMLPVMVHVFLDSRTAFCAHLVVVLITALFVSDSFLFVLLQLTAGLAAIYCLTELTERSQLFRMVLVVLACYCVVNFSYQLLKVSNIRDINPHLFVQFGINAVLLLFTYPLLYLYEKLFRFTSNVTLVELSNINGRLLRTLSEVAPGTFNHSMQVANLAAAAANRVGARSQLVRTGALYHDIGKLENPAFFTENQGSTNPHDSLPFDQSAQIVIGHVAAGLRLAEKYRLPESIRAFIATHHGVGKAKYFYVSQKNLYPDEEIDESLFTYPGPEPNTMETAILMMADAVEAASRSLGEYTEESIGNFVDRIIDGQVADGCFDECPITFRDIRDIKNVFKEKLRTIYHTRISYPTLETK
jgi:putative nucleotidyltransferase with HDIG domain